MSYLCSANQKSRRTLPHAFQQSTHENVKPTSPTSDFLHFTSPDSTPPISANEGTEEQEQIALYADQYGAEPGAPGRLRLANRFFDYLLSIDYIGEPIRFPADAHIDSVDVNVYYYLAEWHYAHGLYQRAADLCTEATHHFGEVDDVARSDVYSLLGSSLFRLGSYEQALQALSSCYELDKAAGDFDRMSSTLNSMASVLTHAGRPEDAEKYILEALYANSLTDNLRRRAVLQGIASEIYATLSKPDLSLLYATQALQTERALGDSTRIGMRLSQLAGAQMALSRLDDARQTLLQATPLLAQSAGRHSYAICKNQMGDILACQGQAGEAASCYREAAMLFMEQGDRFGELHAREGLYKVLRQSAPADALIHLERAKQLQDSIYQAETADAMARYNAIYGGDIVQREAERAARHHRIVLAAVVCSALLLLALAAAAFVILRRRSRLRENTYRQDISSLQDQVQEVSRHYHNLASEQAQHYDQLTDDDRQFIQQFERAVSDAIGRGDTDLDAIASLMHTSTPTLRRRLAQTLGITPKAFIHQVRMAKAKQLLQDYRDLTISEVADRCGYSLLPNFTRAFKNYYGIMPSELRKPNKQQ